MNKKKHIYFKPFSTFNIFKYPCVSYNSNQIVYFSHNPKNIIKNVFLCIYYHFHNINTYISCKTFFFDLYYFKKVFLCKTEETLSILVVNQYKLYD